MKLGDLPPAVLQGRLAAGKLQLRLGPFVTRLHSTLPALTQGLSQAYRDFELAPLDAFADFHIDLLPERGQRFRQAPQARFYLDGRPSATRDARLALTLLEDGLNDCVAARAHQFLVLRAAVVERGGCAALLAGPAGAGKSALSAALVQRGWRLLSDALALLDLDTGLVHGMARPIGLRNGAIAAARDAAPGLRFTPEVGDAALGTAALACPPTDSVSRMHEPAWPAWLLLLHPQPQQATEIEPQGAADSFMQLASDALNYALHGRRGFEGLGDLIDHCSCHRLRYRTLAEGADAIDRLAAQPPCPAARAC